MPSYRSLMAAVLTVIAATILGLLSYPFAKPFAWAFLIAIATMPHYLKLRRRMPRHDNLSASLMVLIVILFMVLPCILLVLVIVDSSDQWSKELENLARSLGRGEKTLVSRLPFLNQLSPYLLRYGFDLKKEAAQVIGTVSRYLVDSATSAALNLVGSLATLALFLFILFFLYRDGEQVVQAGVERFARDRDRVRHYIAEIRATTSAVLVGTLFTCLIQGVFAGIAYYFADVPVPVILGALTAVMGVVPVVGTAVVWGPLVAMLAFRGDYLAALLLFAWCLIVVVAVADNVVRPLAVGAKSNIHPMAVVLGAVGGVITMGLLGLILGPIVFALLVTLWRDLTAARHGDPGSSANS